MVQLSHYNLIAHAPASPQRSGNVERDSCHVVPKRDLVGRTIEKISKCLPRLRQCGISLVAGRKVPVGIGVMMIQVISHRLHDRTWDLGTSGPIEIGNALAIVYPIERRKTRPYFLS